MKRTDHRVSVPRDDVLDAAFAVLARSGPPKPDAVAVEAGVSKALVYHHFQTVDGLRDAMAERVLRQTQEGLDAFARDYPNARERLEAFVRALVSEPPEPPRAALHVLRFWLEPDAEGTPRAALRDALVADFVAKTLKEMRSTADARHVASAILARWHGTTLVYATGGAVDFDAEFERAREDVEEMIG